MISFRRHPLTQPCWVGYLTLFLFLFLFLAISLFNTACRKETLVQRATREKILLLGNGAEPKALDPHIVQSVGDGNILRALFEGLVTNDPSDDSANDPGVAERWESNSKYTRWVFHLRHNARWSNGDPVTARDFVWSYHRILHPKMGAPYASMLYFLKNGEAYNKGEIVDFSKVGVKAVDDDTLVCNLENPAPYFPDVVKHTTWLPVHRGTIEKFGKMTDSYTRWQLPGNHVSNGAFKLTDWRIGAYVKVRRNPYYWDKENVKPRGINFYPIDNQFTEEKAFRNGLLHLSYTVPQNLIDSYRKKKNTPLRIETYAGVYFYRCNVNRPPTDNINFRKALSYAINREIIVKYVTMGGQQPASGYTPPSKGGYHPPDKVKFDPILARQFLKKAGYQSGAEVPEFTIFINTSEAHKDIAVSIQDMWKKHLGLKNIKIENQEWKVFQQSVQDQNYDVSRAGWIGDYADPNTFLSMFVTGDSNNRTGWSNPDYDRLLAEAAALSDPKQRYAKLFQAEEVLLDKLPVLPVYWYTRVYLKSPDLKNWNPLLLDNHPYKYIDVISD